MRGVTTRHTTLEIRPMILVECPICDHDAPFDPARDELACEACGVALTIAPEPHAELAAAA
jgi:ribosomal protein S27E